MFDKKQLAFLESVRKKINKALCNCMYPQCTEKPIYSHVFQKEGVLQEISTDRKVIAFEYRDLFALERGECPVCYKESGINETFGFYGFCNLHDTKVFAPIEPKDKKVDWYDEKNQYLLGYRTLCREYYAQLQIQKYLLAHLESEYSSLRAFLSKADCNYSISVFEKYKTVLEKGIWGKDYSRYSFKTTELPFRLELCLASPIVIREESKGPYFGPDENVISDTANIITIFPHKNRTVVMVGFLEGEKNIWANTIYSMLRSDDIDDVSRALQDIMFRSEFHCMSKLLYNEIESEIPAFLQEWNLLREAHDYYLPYSSNIFRKYIRKQCGFAD